jgi:hypothetical protein
MKKLLLPAIALCLSGSAVLAGNWFGSGPWANATYFPGNLDGKYQASVFGANVSGVLGFAIRDGAPPFLESQNQQAVPLNSNTISIVSNQQIGIDNSLNYFAVFVNGRTYVGTTAATINYDNSSVAGTLIGTQPSTLTTTNKGIVSQLITNVAITSLTNTNSSVTTQNITNKVPVVITNTTNVITSGLVTNLVTTNETVQVDNNGVITTTNITYTLTNIETVLFTNTVQVPVVIGTNDVVDTILITNETSFVTAQTNTNVETVLFTNDLINATLVSTGVDGAFQAGINSKQAVFTFQGPGQLTSPGLVTNGTQVNPTIAFNVNGIRVSFSSTANFQSLTPTTGAPQQ